MGLAVMGLFRRMTNSNAWESRGRRGDNAAPACRQHSSEIQPSGSRFASGAVDGGAPTYREQQLKHSPHVQLPAGCHTLAGSLRAMEGSSADMGTVYAEPCQPPRGCETISPRGWRGRTDWGPMFGGMLCGRTHIPRRPPHGPPPDPLPAGCPIVDHRVIDL